MHHSKSLIFRIITLVLILPFFISQSFANFHISNEAPRFSYESTSSSSSSYSVIEHNDKKGLADEKGALVIPAKYDDLGWSHGIPKVIDNVIGYKENNYWGLISIKNSRITAPLYSQMIPFNDHLVISAKRENHTNRSSYGIINTKGKAIVPFKYYSLQAAGGNLIAGVEKDGGVLYGLIDFKNNVLLPFDYSKIHPVSDNRLAITNSSGKVALTDSRGARLLGFELDSIAVFTGNTATVYMNGKIGLINSEGKMVIKPVYKEIIEESHGYRGLHYPEWKIIDGKNNLISKLEYDEVIPAGENVYKVRMGNRESLINSKEQFLTPVVKSVGDFENKVAIFNKENKYGVINNHGEVVVKPVYDSVFITEAFILALKRNLNNKWSVFNHEGDSLTEITYQDVASDKNGLLAVKRNNSWGFINNSGKEIIPRQYDSVENFEGNVAKAKYLGSEGVINNEGQWLANPWHEYVQPISDNIFYFRSGKKCGLMGPGNKYIYTTDNAFFPINSGFIERNNENKLGLVNAKGKVILKTEYDEISHLQGDTIYIFKKDNKYGIITKSGKIKVGLNNNFQELHPLKDNYLGVKINNKYGFVDINGALRISNQYDAIGHYQENLAPIKLRGNWGYIDKIERIIIQPAFDLALSFNDGLAIVMKNGKYGLVNREGKLVLPMDYDRLEITDSKRYLCYQGNKVGMTSEEGRLMIFPKFDHIEDLHNGYAIIKRQNKCGLMTTKGVDTIPLVYDTLIYDPYNDLYLCSNAEVWESIANK